jgi:fructose-1,6-bisphosphatase
MKMPHTAREQGDGTQEERMDFSIASATDRDTRVESPTPKRHASLAGFLAEQLREVADEPDRARLQRVIEDLALAVAKVTSVVARGALGLDAHVPFCPAAPGDERRHMELLANEVFVAACERNACVAGLASQALNAVLETGAGGDYLVAFDPLDAACGTDLNVAAGSIFSVLRRPAGQAVCEAAFLRNGREQVAAGYAIYGPATMLVLTVGLGTHGFTLDREEGVFRLTHPFMRLPGAATEFSANASRERFWEPPVQRYVRECRAGSAGERQQDFSTRWVASMVADVHRLLMRGGVYLHPRDRNVAGRAGGLRLLYAANPMAFVVEQAGGLASTGRERIRDLVPQTLCEHASALFGTRVEVERLERYHREFDNGIDKPFVSPLFNERSLFRPEARI